VNRLAQETSPYLQQHAHNPVDWQPWDDEALARARDEDRPILLSIGYAEITREHRWIVRDAFGSRGGTEFDTQGDS